MHIQTALAARPEYLLTSQSDSHGWDRQVEQCYRSRTSQTSFTKFSVLCSRHSRADGKRHEQVEHTRHVSVSVNLQPYIFYSIEEIIKNQELIAKQLE